MSYSYNRRKKNRKQMLKDGIPSSRIRDFCEKKGIGYPPRQELIGSVEEILEVAKK